MRLRIASAALLPALTLAVAMMLGGCKSEAQRHFDQAVDHYDKKDWKDARAEFEQAVKLDPKMLDAHKALAQLDEFFGDEEGAGREYDAASMLDPTDQKLTSKVRYYRLVKQMASQADDAMGDIKIGKFDEGLATLKDVMVQSKSKAVRQHALATLGQAAPIIAQQGDDLAGQKKYADALKAYDAAIRAYMLITQATGQTSLDSAADKVLHSANQAAKLAGTPDVTFKMLNDVLGLDPDDKAANMELAQTYLSRDPPDYSTAADLMERAGAPDAEVAKLRAKAKRH
ncbi:MAG: tetratricopeptide repeat protein [Candidatus Binataceae bacterium]